MKARSLILLMCVGLRTVSASESSFLQMLFVPPDPVSLSLGGANASIVGAASFLTNPSHVARATRPTLSASTVLWWEDISLQSAGVYLPLTAAWSAGVCSLSSDYGNIDSYSALGTPMGTLSAGDSFFSAGAAYKAGAFAGGLSLVKLSQRLSVENVGSAAALHAGAEYRFGFLNTGLSYFAPTGKMDFGSGASPQTIPSIMRAGINFRFMGALLTAAGTFPSEGAAFQSFGIEIPAGKVLSVRTGMNTMDSVLGFSAGAGLKYDRFSFDYGFSSAEIGDSLHSLSFSARMGYSTLKIRLYREAGSLFRQGFYERAQQTLNDVLILDPDYRKAKLLSARIARIIESLENPSTEEGQ